LMSKCHSLPISLRAVGVAPEDGLGIERVDVARTAVDEEVDDVVHLRAECGGL